MMGAGSMEHSDGGYRCEACGNGASFTALKAYWHKVEIDASGMVLEDHGIRLDDDELEEVECRRCGATSEPTSEPTSEVSIEGAEEVEEVGAGDTAASPSPATESLPDRVLGLLEDYVALLETELRNADDEDDRAYYRRQLDQVGTALRPGEAGEPGGPGGPPGANPSYRCLTCGNVKEFHRFYVEEARERLDANGDWVIVEAWEFADGGETTFGAICTPCDAENRDDEVVDIEPEPEWR